MLFKVLFSIRSIGAFEENVPFLASKIKPIATAKAAIHAIIMPAIAPPVNPLESVFLIALFSPFEVEEGVGVGVEEVSDLPLIAHPNDFWLV